MASEMAQLWSPKVSLDVETDVARPAGRAGFCHFPWSALKRKKNVHDFHSF